MKRRALYWMTQDLRLADNSAWQSAQYFDRLTCVYIVDPGWFKAGQWQISPMGASRWSFIQECLTDLNTELSDLGQQLYILYGRTELILSQLVVELNVDCLISSRRAGTDENRILSRVADTHPAVSFQLIDNSTLFNRHDLPLALNEYPVSYSRFRRQAETHKIRRPIEKPHQLPPPSDTIQSRGRFCLPGQSLQLPDWVPNPPNSMPLFQGGEAAARQHLDQYFSSKAPSVYKEVRNHLSGWQNSSKLSPWLNQGCVSPRQIKSRIDEYELSYRANDSTHWLFIELLWREYFQWLHHAIGKRIYLFKGLADHPPLTSYYSERFRKWCGGNTPYDLVNACMNELKETGYMSNRGRQIVASCLVNELSIDWRYGAAWFEHHLIDYDPAVNWGNWQYIAGVGVDPRGGRHFNLEKQTAQFDPDGEFRRKWDGVDGGPLDSTDMVDWPIAR